MSYEDFVAKDIRLRVLTTLEDDADYAHNVDVIRSALRHKHGHDISRDLLRTELYWLADQGAVTINDGDGLMVVKLTNKGEDIALGRMRVPGINRPSPQ